MLGLLLFFFLPSMASAANRYWVGAVAGCDGTWADADCWAATSNGAGGAGVPGAADDVFFDGVGNGASNSTLGTVITINSLDMTGYANTLTHNAVQLTMDSGGVFKFSAAMTYSRPGGPSSNLGFTGTSGTAQITTAGKVLGNVTFNGTGGTWQLQDAFSGSSITLTRGTFDTNNQTVTADALNSNNNNVRTLTLGSSAITLSQNAVAVDFLTTTNMTVTANTAVITMNGSAPVFRSDARNWNGLSLVFSGAAGTLQGGGGTLANVTRTGTAVRTNTFNISGDVTITGTFTVNGNSNVNRMLVTSNTLGTASTITSAANSISNADFRDITGAGAGDWNLSAITGLSGDAGGNSGITFTTAQTQYWVGNGGNWSDAAEWGTTSGGSGGRVPLPQDDVIFDNNSFNGTNQTATVDMPRAGKSIDWSAYNENQGPNLNITGVGTTVYGSLTLNSQIGTLSNSIGVTFEGRGSFTLTTGGKSFAAGITLVAMVGGTLTLQDAFSSLNSLRHTNGTLDSNGFNVTVSNYNHNQSPTATRALILGGSTWILGEGSAGFLAWNGASNTGLTFNAGTSTIIIPNTATTAKTFAGGGLTYNNVIFSGDNITITGSNFFNQFKVNNSGLPTGLIVTSGTNQVVTAFSTDASLGRVAKIQSSSAGVPAIIAKSGSFVCVEYMSIKDIIVSPAVFYAANSIDVSGNSGWTFSQCPSPNETPRTSGGPANVKISSSPAAGGMPGWYGSAWGYRRPIVIDRTRVATTSALTNFPVVISVIDPDLRSTGNGGKVASTTGGDLVFTSSDGTTLLDFEIEKYASTTGELVAWVRVPSLSGVTDTTLYMYLGNAAATNLQNPTGVWDSNYSLVYHVKDSSPSLVGDSTTNANTLTNTNATTASGEIDGAVSVNGTDAYLSANATPITAVNNWTMEAWINPGVLGVLGMAVYNGNDSGGYGFGIGSGSGSAGSKLQVLFGSIAWVDGGYTFSTANKWYHVVVMRESGTTKFYVDGEQTSNTSSSVPGTVASRFSIGMQFNMSNVPTRFFNGRVDEVRVSNVVRGSDWIKTSYNNQIDPARFYSYKGLESMNGRVNSSGVSVPFLKVRGGVKFR